MWSWNADLNTREAYGGGEALFLNHIIVERDNYLINGSGGLKIADDKSHVGLFLPVRNANNISTMFLVVVAARPRLFAAIVYCS